MNFKLITCFLASIYCAHAFVGTSGVAWSRQSPIFLELMYLCYLAPSCNYKLDEKSTRVAAIFVRLLFVNSMNYDTNSHLCHSSPIVKLSDCHLILLSQEKALTQWNIIYLLLLRSLQKVPWHYKQFSAFKITPKKGFPVVKIMLEQNITMYAAEK